MELKLIDIHCHLDFPDFNKDRGGLIKKAQQEGLGMINVGANFKTSKSSALLAQKHEGIWACVGVHPHDADEYFDWDELEMLAGSPRVVAIGECGMDFIKSRTSKEEQEKMFRSQIELALELDKPLMLHIRDAHSDVTNILNEYKSDKKLRGDIHFCTANMEQAEEYLEMGFSLSFTGVITFSNQYDEVIENTPLEKIMIETDAPYVAPVPYRGKRCEPAHVREVAKRIAEIKGLSFEDVAIQTTKNAVEFFGLK